MISSRLLHAGIAIAAFFIMATTFQGLTITLWLFLSQTFSNHGNVPAAYIESLIAYSVIFLLTLLIVRKSGDIASWLSDKGKIVDEIKIRLGYAKIFSIVLVSYSVFSIMKKLPVIVNALLDAFQSKIHNSGGLLSLFDEEKDSGVNWLSLIIEVVMYVLIIYTAKPISKWFSRRFEDDDDEFSFEEKPILKEPATETTVEP